MQKELGRNKSRNNGAVCIDVHTTPAEFKNEGFTQRTHLMFTARLNLKTQQSLRMLILDLCLTYLLDRLDLLLNSGREIT